MNRKKLQEEKIIGKYINPFTDFGFKKIFGEEPNKDLLIDFLNELLKSQNQQIKNLTYKKTEHLGTSTLDRKVIFDLYCENEQGEKFIVELQKAKQTFFKDRALFYSTFPIQEQGIKGKWDYQLKAVFAIAILDFTFENKDKSKTIVEDKTTKPDEYINKVQLMDVKQKKVFYDKLTYVYIQMPNFNKEIDDLETHLDKWLYVIKHLDTLERIPEKIKDKIFKKVFKVAEFENLSKKERQSYEDSLKYYRDLKNSFDTAEEDGRKKEREKLMPAIKEAKKREAKERKDKEKAQQREAEAQKREAEAQKREAEAQKREAEAQKREAEAQKRTIILIKSLINEGKSIVEIAALLNTNSDKIKQFLNS